MKIRKSSQRERSFKDCLRNTSNGNIIGDLKMGTTKGRTLRMKFKELSLISKGKKEEKLRERPMKWMSKRVMFLFWILRN